LVLGTEESRADLSPPASSLPSPLSKFVGRERELADVCQLLGSTRLLTLVGTGGVGKTRLAIELARTVARDYPDGVVLVDLAALSDEKLLPQTTMVCLGLQETAAQAAMDGLVNALRSKRVLLVLDNCEHLVRPCAGFTLELLRDCHGLRILVTSREPLGVSGETSWRVPSLAVPDTNWGGTDEIATCDAVRLFLDRARAVLPSFALTDRNAASIAQICRQLDGIPLALELAAAWVRVLGPDQILALE
jgi:predicted ATPase